MIAYILVSIMVIFSLVFITTQRITQKIVTDNLKNNARYMTTGAVERIEKVLSSIKRVPDNFAELIRDNELADEDIQELVKLMVENNEDIEGACFAYEPYYKSDTQKYYSMYYYRKEGEIAFRNLGNDLYDYFLMDWYQVPKELGKAMWSEPYFDDGGADMVISTYSIPIYLPQDGVETFTGILTIDISLDWLQEYVNQMKIYDTGYGFMISNSGTIITHPITSLILNETVFTIADEQESPALREIGRHMIRGETSFAEVEYHNVRSGSLSWIAYAPISLNGWSLGMVFPVNEFMADANQLKKTVFALGIGGSLFIILIIILIARSITSPLRKLTRATEKFAEGDFEVALPVIHSKDEIGRLNTAFHAMQTTLASTISDLKNTSEQLKVSNEKLEDYSHSLEQMVDERTAELKQKNEALDEAFTNIKTLNEIGKKITSTLDIDSIQELVYENVNSMMDASSFAIMIYNKPEQKLECNLTIEKGVKLPPFEMPMADKNRFAVWCVDNASPIFMNDVDTEYSRYVAYRAKPKAGESVSSLIYLPMMIEERIIGVLSAQSFQKNAYTQFQLDMLENLANFVAIALDNAMAYKTIQKANEELKAAQAQLIQSEKMASLGQLTAGIAHEIKNPLNFVNNFSELSVELATEIIEEIDKWSDRLDARDADYVKGMLQDIESNLKKINDHGKRADSIIRSMLLHSRGKAGEMQPTDLNALLAEYVSIGYHGIRATDNTFNIKIEADYDPDLGKITVVPQDIGRVFLNLINNACYATIQKKKELGESYFPILSVSTKREENQVVIRVRDNGKGIPQEIIDKIFNPFFTTKPAGSGTGLGLSISYDIIVQEHGGEFIVNSQEKEYAEFQITLPIK